MIADLHCHYPMHLLKKEYHPRKARRNLLRSLKGDLKVWTLNLTALLFNNPGWSARWRVNLRGLERGRAAIVCSVLYWPTNEFSIEAVSSPRPESFERLKKQLDHVDRHLGRLGPTRCHIATDTSDLTSGGVAFVHCVEGGFNLGPDKSAIDANVAWLAKRGVAYITVAHLIFRGVATNAPAIPFLSDRLYDLIFPQNRSLGLTDLGRAVVRAMYRHGVLVDISHMSEPAIDDTFNLIEAMDRECDREPSDYPVIATHVGIRSAGGKRQAYNLSDATVKRIQARGGVIGLIMAQHQLGRTWSRRQSQQVLSNHINAIVRLDNGSYGSCAIGTDLDGYIKPTIRGIKRARSLRRLEKWIRSAYGNAAADAILHDNAARVLACAYDARSRPPCPPPAPIAPVGGP